MSWEHQSVWGTLQEKFAIMINKRHKIYVKHLFVTLTFTVTLPVHLTFSLFKYTAFLTQISSRSNINLSTLYIL